MKIILLLILAISLQGCFWNTKPITIVSKPITRIPLIIPDIDIYSHRNIDWITITPENAKEMFAEIKKRGLPLAIIGVTGEGYELLTLNDGDRQVLIKQLLAQISAYKKYYIVIEKSREEESNQKQ